MIDLNRHEFRCARASGLRPARAARLAAVCLSAAALAAAAGEDGFVPLFNGTDLSGWVNVNGAPETWSIRDGVVECTGQPISVIRTERQVENFILEIEWRHLAAGGNSGIFLWAESIPSPGSPFPRGIEVQVLDNGFDRPGKNGWYTTHGDVFPVNGSTMTPRNRICERGRRSFPVEDRSLSSPEWNRYRIVATNGTIRLSVNGREVTVGEDCLYRKGYLMLESEGSPIEFRNARIRELPSGDADGDLAAPGHDGWRSLFNGVDLRGWRGGGGWSVAGGRMTAGDAAESIRTDGEYGDARFFLDCRLAKGGQTPPTLLFRGMEIPLAGADDKTYRRFTLTVANGTASLSCDDSPISGIPIPADAPSRSPLEIRSPSALLFNLFVRPPTAGLPES